MAKTEVFDGDVTLDVQEMVRNTPYSSQFKAVLTKMLHFSTDLRPDFLELDRILTENGGFCGVGRCEDTEKGIKTRLTSLLTSKFGQNEVKCPEIYFRVEEIAGLMREERGNGEYISLPEVLSE